jgi:hypothetical protein
MNTVSTIISRSIIIIFCLLLTGCALINRVTNPEGTSGGRVYSHPMGSAFILLRPVIAVRISLTPEDLHQPGG